MDILNNKKDDPIVLNLSQTLEYQDNFLVGRLANPPKPVEANDEVRKIFEWYPHDAVEKQEAQRLQKTSVRSGHVLTIGQGEVSPRKVYMLLPDKFSEVPGEVKRSKVGNVLAQFYQQKQYERALKIVADNQPEIMDKVRTAVKSSELDDQIKKQVQDELEMLQKIADDSGSSSD